MALGTLALIAASIGASASEPTFTEEISMVGPAVYATGGDTGLQAAYRALGVAQSGRTIVAVLPVDCKGYTVAWDTANSKIKFYQVDPTAGAVGPQIEVAAATVLSGVTFRLLIISK